MAPGEQIVSTGAFGGVCVVGGTSLAAPHVTAVASVLWEKDRTVSADFIRSLLAFSANQYGEDYEYGYGLVDLEFALSQYDAFCEVYVADESLNEQLEAAVEDGTLEVNEKAVEEFEDVTYVEGSWWKDANGNRIHDQFATVSSAAGSLSGSDLAIVKLGALAPDQYFDGMYRNAEWHGQQKHSENGVIYHCNYVFSYIYLTEIAKAVGNGVSPLAVNSSFSLRCAHSTCKSGTSCVSLMKQNIKRRFTATGMVVCDSDTGEVVRNATWSELLGGRSDTNLNKSLYIYGLALHTLTDTFAHSSYKPVGSSWARITHNGGADDISVVPNRIDCTYIVSSYLIAHIIEKTTGSLDDYYNMISTGVYDTNAFRLGNLSEFIDAIDSSYYTVHKSRIDSMSFFHVITE